MDDATTAWGSATFRAEASGRGRGRARRLCPGSALANLSAGWPISHIGAHAEAFGAFDAGVRLDPLGDMAIQWRMAAGYCHVMTGWVETGVQIMEQVVAGRPSQGSRGVLVLLSACWTTGRTEGAQRTAGELHRIDPDLTRGTARESSPYVRRTSGLR